MTEEGLSNAIISSLLWLFSLGESLVFVILCDVGKPFTAKDLKPQECVDFTIILTFN